MVEEALFSNVEIMSTVWISVSHYPSKPVLTQKVCEVIGCGEMKKAMCGLKTLDIPSPGWVSNSSAAEKSSEGQYGTILWRSSPPPGSWLIPSDPVHNQRSSNLFSLEQTCTVNLDYIYFPSYHASFLAHMVLTNALLITVAFHIYKMASHQSTYFKQ